MFVVFVGIIITAAAATYIFLPAAFFWCLLAISESIIIEANEIVGLAETHPFFRFFQTVSVPLDLAQPLKLLGFCFVLGFDDRRDRGGVLY